MEGIYASYCRTGEKPVAMEVLLRSLLLFLLKGHVVKLLSKYVKRLVLPSALRRGVSFGSVQRSNQRLITQQVLSIRNCCMFISKQIISNTQSQS